MDPEALYWDLLDAGLSGNEVAVTEAIAWPSEQDSINDDGRNAVVRVIIPE